MILPWPPSVNKLYSPAVRKTKTGKTYVGRRLSDEAHYWKEIATVLAKQGAPVLPDGLLELRLDLYPPRAGSDADNRTKLVQDTLAQAWGINDVRFGRVVAERHAPNKHAARVVVTVTAMEET